MATYTDDFNRPDSTNIGNWTEVADNWSIISNQLAPGTAATSFVIYASPLDTSDHYSEIVIPNASASSMGVLARGDANGTNFYLWRGDGTTWDLFAKIGGNFIGLATYVGPLNNGDVARIECVGSTIKGYINGIERASATDTQILTGAFAGIRSAASPTARFDNFVASDIGGAPPDTSAFFDFM